MLLWSFPILFQGWASTVSGCQWRLTLDFWRLNMKKGENHSGSAGRALLLSSSDRETNNWCKTIVLKNSQSKSKNSLDTIKASSVALTSCQRSNWHIIQENKLVKHWSGDLHQERLKSRFSYMRQVVVEIRKVLHAPEYKAWSLVSAIC